MKTTLFLEIDYDPDRTDPESLAAAMDRLMETACSIPGILDEYANPKIGEFWVASAGTARGTARQIVRELLECPDSNLDELEPSTEEAIRRGQEFLAAETHHQVDLEALCQKVAESAANWASCSDARESLAVFRELGNECRKLCEERLGEQTAPRYVLYDFDAGDLANTTVYTDYYEAADDADQLDNVLVVALRIPPVTP